MNIADRFRWFAFIQVLLGMAVFTYATGHPELMVISAALGAAAWWVCEGPGGKPFSPLVINLASLVAVAYLILELMGGTPIPLAVGKFVLWLQVLLLYARKTNRDYGQMLLLSFMLMVGATILSASLAFGVIFLFYCGLAFTNVLLLQLKIAQDGVRPSGRSTPPAPPLMGATALAESFIEDAPPVFGRRLRWHFRLSAATLGMTCAGLAIAVFLFLPRRDVDRSAIQDLLAPAEAQPGFSSVVDLGTSPSADGGAEVVLTMRLSIDGQPLRAAPREWLLRGAALDEYDLANHTWRRGRSNRSQFLRELDVPQRGLRILSTRGDPRMLRAEVSLHAGSDRTLFTMQPLTRFESESIRKILLDGEQQALLSAGPMRGVVTYAFEAPLLDSTQRRLVTPIRPRSDRYAAGWELETARITELIEEVLTERGVEMPHETTPAQGKELALEALAAWLSDTEHFSYTLYRDPIAPGEDPILNFLFRDRRGHCEEYASAFAAMARCLGLQSRVVTGFRASEFNESAGYYVVRNADAHAWAEVYLPWRGWVWFDPTPPAEVAAEAAAGRPWLLGVRQRLEHLELIWHRAVISYDARTRSDLLEGVSDRVDDFIARQTWLADLVDRFRRTPVDVQAGRWSALLPILLTLVILASAALVVHGLIVHRRRLAALRLLRLPRREQRTLGRQLAFYLAMLRILERHGQRRPAWQGPAQFTAALANTNPECYAPAVALTDYFYQVRFGDRPLGPAQKSHIDELLQTLEAKLNSGAGVPPAIAAKPQAPSG